MENMNQLRDLLKHEVKDLYSAEEQIIEALPAMIEKASNPALKDALNEHLQITEQQKNRLDKVLDLLNKNEDEDEESEGKGFLSGLFSGSEKKCKAMEGIIKEGENILNEDMTPEVMDAAIIAAAQKVEHYEICGYGTARAYAQELNLQNVEGLLRQTLDEEYEADDLLTELAESRINLKAIPGNKSKVGYEHSPEKTHRSTTRTLRTKSKQSTTTASSSKRGKSSPASNGRTKSASGRTKNSSSKNAPARKRSGGGRGR